MSSTNSPTSADFYTVSEDGSQLRFRIYQVEGQKFARIQDGEDEQPPPATKCEVYVCNIPRDSSIESILLFFIKCGEIYQLRLLMDFSGYNRGKCFVLYKEVRASREAICCMNGEAFRGHILTVKLSLNNDQLILKSIPAWISESYIRDLLEKFFCEDISRIVLKSSKVPYKKYCFCQFKDHYSAAKAHKKIWPYLNLDGNVVDVHWAVPHITRYARNLYFTNFPSNMSKKEFFDIISIELDLLCVVQIRLQNYYGSITFINFKALERWEKNLKNLSIRGCKIKFSKMPFAPRGVDRISVEFFQNQTLQQQPPGFYATPAGDQILNCQMSNFCQPQHISQLMRNYAAAATPPPMPPNQMGVRYVQMPVPPIFTVNKEQQY